MTGIPYILITVIVLAIIFIIVAIKAKRAGKRLRVSTLAPIAMILIIGGIILNDKVLSYSLMAAGVIIAVVDSIRVFKKSSTKPE